MLYHEHKALAAEVCSEWLDAARWPRVPTPEYGRWQDPSSADTHTLIGWSGMAFDELWLSRIERIIQEACIADVGIWKWQRSPFAKACAQFFAAGPVGFCLNLITVTPSRIPTSLWVKQGRPVMVESFGAPPKLYHRVEEIEIDLPDSFRIRAKDWLWAIEPGGETPVGLVRANRILGRRESHFGRLFEYDRDRDAALVGRGSVPAVFRAAVGQGDAVRIHAPMIQLWKIRLPGTVSLVNFETFTDTGFLADIRWTHQRFKELLNQDPYFAQVLWMLITGKTKRLMPG